MTDTRRVGDLVTLVVGLVMTGAVLSSLVELPGRTVEVNVLGSPLGLGLSGHWVLAGLLVALAAVGTDAIVRSAPGFEAIDWRYTVTFWVLPCLVALTAAVAVPGQFGDVRSWLGNALILGTLLAAVLLAEYGTVRLDDPLHRFARLGLNVATYAAALALFATIYGAQLRSLISATAIMMVSFPLALELLRGTEEQFAATWIDAAIIAVIMWEFTWAINAWGLSALAGGATLLLVFYALSGITQQHLAQRLSRRVALEFVAVTLVGLTVILMGSIRP